MSKPLFLFGNGLSIALSSDFSLRSITRKFINNLEQDNRTFLEGLCGGIDSISFDDFEQNFTYLESAYDSLKRYREFIESPVGERMLENYGLSNPELHKHEIIIEKIYKQYISQILEIIHGNVNLHSINRKLLEFTNFLVRQLKGSEKGFVFTLNYDLLVETILLEKIGSDFFTDFCFSSGFLKDVNIPKFDFNPRRNEDIHPQAQNIELHHLHGSLSLFNDFSRNRAIKLKSQDIGYLEIYRHIYENKLPLIPAIITGGGKSDKIIQYPFDYYYRSLKDICDFGEASKFYIVGYSFRDEHINDLIKRWIENVEDYSQGLLIIDFKMTREEQELFMKDVKKALKMRSFLPEHCFIFTGVNDICDVPGTKKKEKTRRKGDFGYIT